MDCPAITTLEQAEAKLPSSVLPVSGLRRDEDGILTADAQATIIDGLKSRGVDITDTATKTKVVADLANLLCSVNRQYQFLLSELYKRVHEGAEISEEFVAIVRDKNLSMSDILTVSRLIHISKGYDGTVPFIEGWQNRGSSPATDTSALSYKLTQDRAMLDAHSYEELRRHMVDITVEKNNVASHSLGLYGFLNLVAIGLIIYVAGTNK